MPLWGCDTNPVHKNNSDMLDHDAKKGEGNEMKVFSFNM